MVLDPTIDIGRQAWWKERVDNLIRLCLRRAERPAVDVANFGEVPAHKCAEQVSQAHRLCRQHRETQPVGVVQRLQCMTTTRRPLDRVHARQTGLVNIARGNLKREPIAGRPRNPLLPPPALYHQAAVTGWVHDAEGFYEVSQARGHGHWLQAYPQARNKTTEALLGQSGRRSRVMIEIVCSGEEMQPHPIAVLHLRLGCGCPMRCKAVLAKELTLLRGLSPR